VDWIIFVFCFDVRYPRPLNRKRAASSEARPPRYVGHGPRLGSEANVRECVYQKD
jgi:hypothetical protein